MGGNAAQRDFCASWPNQQKVTVPGLHFFEEDSGATTCQACGEVAFITSLKGKAMTDVPLYMMVNSDSPEYERSLHVHTPSGVSKYETTKVTSLLSTTLYTTHNTVFTSDAVQYAQFSVPSWSRTLAFFGSGPKRVFEVFACKKTALNAKSAKVLEKL